MEASKDRYYQNQSAASGTAETLTHKHRLLWRRSNLLARHLAINDCSISLALGGTCKSPAIDSFDYIYWREKIAERAIRIENADEAEGCVYWRISGFSALGLLSVAFAGGMTRPCARCGGSYVQFNKNAEWEITRFKKCNILDVY